MRPHAASNHFRKNFSIVHGLTGWQNGDAMIVDELTAGDVHGPTHAMRAEIQVIVPIGVFETDGRHRFAHLKDAGLKRGQTAVVMGSAFRIDTERWKAHMTGPMFQFLSGLLTAFGRVTTDGYPTESALKHGAHNRDLEKLRLGSHGNVKVVIQVKRIPDCDMIGDKDRYHLLFGLVRTAILQINPIKATRQHNQSNERSARPKQPSLCFGQWFPRGRL